MSRTGSYFCIGKLQPAHAILRMHGRIRRGGGCSEKSQNKGFPSKTFRFSEKSQSYQNGIQCWAIIGRPEKRHKWRFAGGPMMAHFLCYLDPLSSSHQQTPQKKQQQKTLSELDPSGNSFWICRWHGIEGECLMKTLCIISV